MLNKDFYDKREDISGKFNMKIECNAEDVENIIKALEQICVVTYPVSGIQNIPYTFRKYFHVNCKIKKNIMQLNPYAKGSTNEIKVQLICLDESFKNIKNALNKIFYIIENDIPKKSNKEKIYLTLRFIKNY